jgi:hypothetical protein
LSFLLSHNAAEPYEVVMTSHGALTRAQYERELDLTLAESFPASDPPPWTLGASSWMDVEDTVDAAPALAAANESSKTLPGIAEPVSPPSAK